MADESEMAGNLHALLQRRSDEVLVAWVALREAGSPTRLDSGGVARARGRCHDVLEALQEGLTSGRLPAPEDPAFDSLRRVLSDISLREAQAGSTPSDTAIGVLSLREALCGVLPADKAGDVTTLFDVALAVGRLVDAMALLTFEAYVEGREGVITRQSRQLIELSTPIVKLWDGVLGVPLIGTLDSTRANAVMESLLQAIIEQQASVAILDITGVPTVDTRVAQHLFKTVTATRLMGADCIVSGIRPHTAQTIVQLGIDLTGVTTRATLADALTTAISWIDAGHRGR